MKTTSPFPHDASYDYDADLVNGEIFDTDKPLPEIAPRSIPEISTVSSLMPVGSLSTLYMRRPPTY
jgi:hypothetical protein